MRSNVTLDAKLLEEVKKQTGCPTKAKAVVFVIEDFLNWKKVEKVKDYKGHLRFRKDTALARKKR